MNKYKDFQELPDNYNEQDLRNLFVKRCFEPHLNSPLANDILIYENILDAYEVLPADSDDPYIKKRIKAYKELNKKGRTKALTPEEIAKLKASKANVSLQFPEDTEEQFALRERNFLNPDEPDDPYIRRRVNEYLKICSTIIEESKTDSGKPEDTANSKYTVKSILSAYYYAHRKAIYPMPEMAKTKWVLKEIHEGLEKIYGKSSKSFKNDWTPIFGKKAGKKNRLAIQGNIELAIELLHTFKHPRIDEAIELANTELKERDLKS